MELILLVLIVFLLALAAWHWGVDSRDDLNSLEWERRSQQDSLKQDFC